MTKKIIHCKNFAENAESAEIFALRTLRRDEEPQ
jgi:hypothetical protein